MSYGPLGGSHWASSGGKEQGCLHGLRAGHTAWPGGRVCRRALKADGPYGRETRRSGKVAHCPACGRPGCAKRQAEHLEVRRFLEPCRGASSVVWLLVRWPRSGSGCRSHGPGPHESFRGSFHLFGRLGNLQERVDMVKGTKATLGRTCLALTLPFLSCVP